MAKEEFDFHTHKSAQKWWRKAYPHIEAINFNTCPLDALTPMLSQFRKLARKYPHGAQALRGFGFGDTIARDGSRVGCGGLAVTQGNEHRTLFEQSLFSSTGLSIAYRLIRHNEFDKLTPQGCGRYPIYRTLS